MCLTRLVNEDGWVTWRSIAKSNPTILLPIEKSNTTRIQTFDCLGNGQQSQIKSDFKITTAMSMSKRGIWANAPQTYPAGSMQCNKACSLNIVIKGNIGILLGKGTITYALSDSKPQTFKAKSSNNLLEVLNVYSKDRKTLRISGNDFVLIGNIKGIFDLSNPTKMQRQPQVVDASLGDLSQRTLSRFGFTSDDFSDEWAVAPMSKGTTLEDPSLDLCGSEYQSESERQNRRQVIATRQGSPYIFLSSEVVRYKSSLSANNALIELKDRLKKCIKDGGGVERGGSFIKYEFLDLPKIPVGLVAEDSRVIVLAKIGEGESARNLLAMYQFQDSILSGLYVIRDSRSSFSDAEIHRWLQAGSVIGRRLTETKIN